MGTVRNEVGPGLFAFDNSVYPACAMNMGPQTVCLPHRDSGNKAGGWCSITSAGTFDPQCGGHLVLWELKLVIEFPPGSTINIPSSLITHSNTTIGAAETRVSFTQYAAGALFRWVDQGCRTEARCKDEHPRMFEELREGDVDRFAEACNLYSTVLELRAHLE
jgi:hypothetical protein